jgi:hypothetical protein
LTNIPDYIQVKLDEDQQLINQRLRASATGNIHGYTRTAQRNIPGYGLILEHGIHVLSGLPKVAFKGVLAMNFCMFGSTSARSNTSATNRSKAFAIWAVP